MAQITYYISDVLSGLIVGELPFADVTMDWYMGTRATFKGKLKLSDPDVVARGANTITGEGRNAVWIDVDGTLIWGGIIWITTYDSDSATLEVTASDYWSFFWRRVAATDINVTATEILTIVQSIINADALSDHVPANLTVAYTGSGAQTLDYTYNSSDRKMVGELVEQLGDVAPGFEFRNEVYWLAPGVPACQIVFGRPRIGLPVTLTGAQFDFPGNVTKYTLALDASRHAARVYVRGSSTGTETPETIYEDTTLYTLYPRYDDVTAIDEQSVLALSARGQYLFNARRRKRVTFEVKVRPDAYPSVGTYRVGDDCTVLITDSRFPNGYLQSMRLAAISYDVNQQEVTLTPWIDVDA